MRPALDHAGHRVPRTKPTCLLHTWRPHRQRPFVLALHLHQHQSSRNLHLQYLAKNQSTQHCQSLITQGSDHPPVLEPHMVLRRMLVGCVSFDFHPRTPFSSHRRRMLLSHLCLLLSTPLALSPQKATLVPIITLALPLLIMSLTRSVCSDVPAGLSQ
jgi:hypothetical protein